MKEKVLSILSDDNLTDIEYARRLYALNRTFQKTYFPMLDRVCPSCIICTPGSDGRGEKASTSASPAEFIVFAKALDQDLRDCIEMEISRLCGKSKRLEYKTADNLESFPLTFGNYHPERILDSYNPRFEHDSKDRTEILSALTKTTEFIKWKKAADRLRALYRAAKRVNRSGSNRIRGKEVVHFDIDSDCVTSFYSPQNFLQSFKLGPLRLVQYGLSLRVIREIYFGKINSDTLVSYPFSTLDRLDFLFLEHRLFGNVNKDVLTELVELYAFFMRLYHKAEMSWEIDNNVVSLQYGAQASKVIKGNLKSIQQISDELFKMKS